MPAKAVPVSRLLVGALAIVCVTTGIAIGFLRSWDGPACAAFLRIGVLLGAVWIALPSGKREAAWANISPWSLVGVVQIALACVRWTPLFITPLCLIITYSMSLKTRKRLDRR